MTCGASTPAWPSGPVAAVASWSNQLVFGRTHYREEFELALESLQPRT